MGTHTIRQYKRITLKFSKGIAAAAPQYSMAFKCLPIELNKEIAGYLESDQDLCTFRLICRDTLNAVDGDGLSFWRSRFYEHFDAPAEKISNYDLKATYQLRRNLLRVGALFRNGSTKSEMNCLKVLRDLIIESFPESNSGGQAAVSLNMEIIKRFVYNTDLIRDIFRPRSASVATHPYLTTIRVTLAAWSFDLDLGLETYGFEMSQKMVYASMAKAPLFNHKLEVQMEWVLHVVNFFKYHFTRAEESTLYEVFSGLHALDKPQAWKSQIKDGQTLGRHWKGTYAYILRDEIVRMRRGADDEIFMDHNVDQGEAAIQTLRLEFPEDGDNLPWPAFFEHHLRSLSIPKSKGKARPQETVAQSLKATSFRFEGEGYDDEVFLASGYLNTLQPQNGIPGWQRMTMMKYFRDEKGDYDQHALWAYEGVVLPGGQLILGRWWSPFEGGAQSPTIYSGPFILWNVDGSPTALEADANILCE